MAVDEFRGIPDGLLDDVREPAQEPVAAPEAIRAKVSGVFL